MRRMRLFRHGFRHGIMFAASGLIAAATAPLWAVSLPATGPAQPSPDTAQPLAADTWSAGSSALVPLMAADVEARQNMAVDAPSEGAAPAGKPLDDLQFVRQAAESSRKEVDSAREALPQLKEPQLRQIAQMLVTDHSNANEKLARLAEQKGWPLSAASAAAAPPSGTASSDFDAKWTAEMIAGHERSVAMYRAQAQSGEDKDLRKYARETLPTIERHLAQLRSLQK
jgi:putative membrane protein